MLRIVSCDKRLSINQPKTQKQWIMSGQSALHGPQPKWFVRKATLPETENVWVHSELSSMEELAGLNSVHIQDVWCSGQKVLLQQVRKLTSGSLKPCL